MTVFVEKLIVAVPNCDILCMSIIKTYKDNQQKECKCECDDEAVD